MNHYRSKNCAAAEASRCCCGRSMRNNTREGWAFRAVLLKAITGWSV